MTALPIECIECDAFVAVGAVATVALTFSRLQQEAEKVRGQLAQVSGALQNSMDEAWNSMQDKSNTVKALLPATATSLQIMQSDVKTNPKLQLSTAKKAAPASRPDARSQPDFVQDAAPQLQEGLMGGAEFVAQSRTMLINMYSLLGTAGADVAKVGMLILKHTSLTC
jgi:hypothetical protein